MIHMIQYLATIVALFLYVFYSCFTPSVYRYSGHTNKTILIIGSVHGNEPSGTLACWQLIQYYQHHQPTHNLIIVPLPNPLGYYLGTRYQLKPFHNDLNRNFNDVGKDRVSRIILEYVREADFVIDLHEGYEYHKRYPQSMGSSIVPNQSKVAQVVANDILQSVNQTINDPDKQFVVSDFYTREQCYLPDSLACYCNRHHIDYISIETTGLHMNTQPIDTRVNQHMIAIKEIIQKSMFRL